MSANSKIEWTDHTFNPWIGCTKVSPACDHCYAEVSTPSRTLAVIWGAGQPRRRTTPANWAMPMRWNAQADAFMAQHGRRQRVFCSSLADVFDNEVDPQWRADLFALIEATPGLDWLLLTKRVGNVRGMVPLPWISQPFQHGPDPTNIYPAGWPSNVWLGATICNQEEADRDIPKLLRVPARVRFLSVEPLLGPVAIWRWASRHCERHPGKLDADGKCEVCEGRGIWGIGEQLADEEKAQIRDGLDWVIVGGESGHQARPMHPDWARGLRDQCAAAGVSFMFKQWGEWMPTEREGDNVVLRFPLGAPHGPDQPQFHDWPDGAGSARVGKKAAGRLLDGVQHDGYPA